MIDEQLITIVPIIHPDRGKKGAPRAPRAFIPDTLALTMRDDNALGAGAIQSVRSNVRSEVVS